LTERSPADAGRNYRAPLGGNLRRLSLAELRAVVDHTARCGDGSEALRVARGLRVAVLPSNEATVKRWSPQPKWLIGLASAAGVAGLVVVSSQQHNSIPGLVAERGAEEPSLRPTLPLGRQSRTALVLRWVPYPHARRHDVTLATADLRVLFERAGIESAELAVPAAALTTVLAGARLVWRVEATLDDGRSVESPAFSLELD